MGFDVDTINLVRQNIPSSTTALVLADPKTESPAHFRFPKLNDYIAEGRNLMVLGEPGKSV